MYVVLRWISTRGSNPLEGDDEGKSIFDFGMVGLRRSWICNTGVRLIVDVPVMMIVVSSRSTDMDGRFDRKFKFEMICSECVEERGSYLEIIF